MTGGPDASRRPKTASADCHRARNLTVLRWGAWAFSSHGAGAIEPLAFLSRSLDSLPASRAFARAAISPRPSLLVWSAGRRVSRSPRPSLSPSRESRRIVMIRNTFHRQGPFVGSGDHYSPGPATRTPHLAMGEPLNGTLAPPWALRRSSPVFRDEADLRLRFARNACRWFHPSTFIPS